MSDSDLDISETIQPLEDDEVARSLTDNTTFAIEGVLLPVLSALGVIGNILCVWTFNKKDVELKASFANLLKCLSVFDTIFLCSMFVQYSVPLLSTEFLVWVHPHLTPYVVPLIHISLTGSVYSVVSVALERFITVCFPFTQCQMCNGLGYIIPIVLFSILYNITKFFEIETLSIRSDEWIIADNGTNISTVVFYPIYNGTALRWDPLYSKYVVFVLNFVIMGLIPVFLLSCLNFLIYRSISRATATHNTISSAHRRDTTMARLLMAIVIVFLCCHSTKIVVNFYEAYQIMTHGKLSEDNPVWIMYLVKINHLLLAINSAINIVIYSFKDFKFRSVLFSAFRKKKSSSKSFRTSIRSSFGSSRYRNQCSRINGSSDGYQHTRISSEHINKTVESSVRSISDSDRASSRNLIVETGEVGGPGPCICDSKPGEVKEDKCSRV